MRYPIRLATVAALLLGVSSVALMADAGVKVTLNQLAAKDYDTAREAGKHNWHIRRNDQEFVSVVQGDAMKAYRKTFTENANAVGLIAYPGALIIPTRFAHIPPGAPSYMDNLAEDNIIRARVFAPADQQISAEPHPGELAGTLGEATVKAE